jgi:hypothetical protein
MMSDHKIQEEVHRRVKHLRRNHDVDAWEKFRTWIERDPELICKNINTRWMVSILDTYADYGTDIERACAMIAVSFTNSVKLSSTLWRHAKPKITKQPQDLWNGMRTFSSGENGDMVRNLFRRNAAIMDCAPTIKYIFGMILQRMFSNKITILGALAPLCENPVRQDVLSPFGLGRPKQ